MKEPRPGELWVVKNPMWVGFPADPGDILTVLYVERPEDAAVVWKRDVKILVRGKIASLTLRDMTLLRRNKDIEPLGM